MNDKFVKTDYNSALRKRKKAHQNELMGFFIY